MPPRRAPLIPLLLLAAFLALGAPVLAKAGAGARAAGAAASLAELPGYIPLEQLGLFSHQELSIEVNLAGPLLRMVSESTRGSDPEFSHLIAELKAIRVRVVELKNAKGGTAGPSEALRGQLKE